MSCTLSQGQGPQLSCFQDLNLSSNLLGAPDPEQPRRAGHAGQAGKAIADEVAILMGIPGAMLQRLTMDQNKLGDEAIAAIANAGTRSKSLMHLSLHTNCCGEDFGAAWRSLRGPVLQWITLDKCSSGGPGACPKPLAAPCQVHTFHRIKFFYDKFN